ncbi:MAG: family 20 glycosylhydrolase [Desertimonas sp.]
MSGSLPVVASAAASCRLESWYDPHRSSNGVFRIRLVNTGPLPVAVGAIGFQTVVALTSSGLEGVVLTRLSGHHLVGLARPVVIESGTVLELGEFGCGHRPGHANDGPTGAFLVEASGAVVAVRTATTGRFVVAGVERIVEPPLRLALAAEEGARWRETWSRAVACERRLLRRPGALVDDGTGDRVVRIARERTPIAPEGVEVDGDRAEVTISIADPPALLRGAFGLARLVHRGEWPIGRARWTPRWGWRGLSVDLARQFLPSSDVLDLLDTAAWLGLNRLHLHLTDDEAWRLPVPDYPTLAASGATRGWGWPIPPLLGSGPAPYGRAYRSDELAAWVARGAELGVVVVPEVDLPGHCFAARRSVAALVADGDVTTAPSVQHFEANVLDPGLTATWRFLEAVFGALADCFPGPWVHLGGDEVANGALRGSPAAADWARRRGIEPPDVATVLMAEIIGLAARTTGRRIGVWEEAALSGALTPGTGYALAWSSSASAARLAAMGHDVVAAPADAVYLDMAWSADWWSPGASWSGVVGTDAITRWDPAAGWPAEGPGRLLGVQAALWSEHVVDRPTLDRMLDRRLEAVAAAGWHYERTR